MSTFARPELVATPEWLADQLGRHDLRILDVRWRPDGTGPATFAAGHIPGAAYVDWREELIEAEAPEAGPGLRLAGPDRVAAAMARAGIGDGTSVVIYDDSLSLYAARTWWSLRAYGLESARILDGGLPAWIAERPASLQRQLSACQRRSSRPGRTLGCASRRPTSAALLGSPDVLLIDARARGRVPGPGGQRPTPRAHPGCDQRGRRGHERAGDAAPPRRRRSA